MFTTNRFVRRDPNPSGKPKHVWAAGLEQCEGQEYRGFTYQIDRRVLGVTIQRTMYSVSIRLAAGNRVAYLTNLPTARAAQRAAETWIDGEADAEHRRKRNEWNRLQRVLNQRRAADGAE